MLFDPRPKTRREDLFGRERELENLARNIDSPITVITGIRRIGKSSILSVFLNEVNIPSIIVDVRNLPLNYSLKDFYHVLSKTLSSRMDRFIEIIKGISSIKVLGGEVEIKWKGKGALSLPLLFDLLNRKRVIVAFDEGQKLRGPRSTEILNALAHAYDYDKNITFIFTGSEVGLLYSFLGVNDTKSPLYGRYHYNLTIERFSRDLAEDFLKAGFKELNIEVNRETIEEALSFFNGIPGWLTFFGNEYYKGSKRFALIKDMAVNLALEELENVVKERGKRYATVLRAIALGEKSWGKIKRYVEEKEGSTISSSILSNIIRNLEDLSVIKDYNFLDPLYKEASLKLSYAYRNSL
ncbi:MAG: ATP-binding protein [Nitrososphaerales archaeon]